MRGHMHIVSYICDFDKQWQRLCWWSMAILREVTNNQHKHRIFQYVQRLTIAFERHTMLVMDKIGKCLIRYLACMVSGHLAPVIEMQTFNVIDFWVKKYHLHFLILCDSELWLANFFVNNKFWDNTFLWMSLHYIMGWQYFVNLEELFSYLCYAHMNWIVRVVMTTLNFIYCHRLFCIET